MCACSSVACVVIQWPRSPFCVLYILDRHSIRKVQYRLSFQPHRNTSPLPSRLTLSFQHHFFLPASPFLPASQKHFTISFQPHRSTSPFPSLTEAPHPFLPVSPFPYSLTEAPHPFLPAPPFPASLTETPHPFLPAPPLPSSLTGTPHPFLPASPFP